MSNKEMTTEKRLKVRLYLSLLVYTVVGYGLTLILDYIFSKFDNGIFAWLYWRLDLLFILYLMLGFICIFNYYWKKPWGYLDEVIDATQTVYEQNNHTVSLSEPLKELEEQLNQIKMSVLLSKRAAKEAEEKKNEIIMYLAHDIRTPLTTVIGYLSLLHEAPDMPEQQKEKYVKVALNKAERLEKLINELFEITKYNAHTVIIKKEIVDLHCLIAQVIDERYPTLSANGKTMKAYLTGKVIPIEEVNDGVFSAKIMGDGIAIIPENEVLTAPADGEITVVMDGSFHAVGMRLDNGVELLLHIGVDTVGMNGEGFKPYVTVGDKVKTGDNLIGFSKSAIAAHGLRDVTMLIVTNGDECPPVKLMSGMDAVAGETVVAEM